MSKTKTMNSEELPNSEDLLTSSLRPGLDATHVDHERAQNGLERRGSRGEPGEEGLEHRGAGWQASPGNDTDQGR